MQKLQLGNLQAGKGEPAFIIAEIGINHQGNVNIARKLNVRGWVCNLANGSVEGIICGRLENIEQLIKACRGGPSLAEVSSLEVIKIGSVPGDVSELFEQRSFHQS